MDEAGLVTGGAVGETSLTVTDRISGLSAAAVVHVCYPVTAVGFAEASAAVSAGFTVPLTANVTMRTQSCVNHLVVFSSSDESVAVVDAAGVVRGIAPGTAVITAAAVSDASVTAACTVTVGVPVILTLPADLAVLESGAFTGLPLVDAIRLPAGVTDVAGDAFDPGMTLILPAGSPWARWAADHGFGVMEE